MESTTNSPSIDDLITAVSRRILTEAADDMRSSASLLPLTQALEILHTIR